VRATRGQSRDSPRLAPRVVRICNLFGWARDRQVARAYLRRVPRRARREIVDGLCHVTARGNRRARIFRRDTDYGELLLLIDEAVCRYDVMCHGFCLMPNHYHLVLDAPQPNLSAALGLVNGVFAQRLNRRYGFSGHVFQGRFGSKPIIHDSHFMEVVRYVLRNPVRARICADPADWPWSSYHGYLDEAERPEFLTVDSVLGLFSTRRESARRAFTAFVANGDRPGTVPYPKPYSPAKRLASRRTRRAAGSPTTFR
jgi:putative transposase